MTCTRALRVRRINAAVALAAAALACSAQRIQARTPAVGRTIIHGGDQAQLGALCAHPTLETCFDARDNDCDGLFDEGCGLPDGALQLIVAWDAPEVDVDLSVVDPEGYLAQVGQVTALGLTKDRDCPRTTNECGGQNLEVVSRLGQGVPMGRYRVLIRLVNPIQVMERIEVRLGGKVGSAPITGAFTLSTQNSEVRFELEQLP